MKKKKTKKKILVKGVSWTKTRLEKICDSIDTVSKEKIVDNYWEYIPEGNYSLNEKIMFIICSISNGAAFPNELLVLQLKQGPCFVNKKDYIFAKPNIAKTVYEKVGKENVNKKIKRWSERHIHCPFSNNLEWAFLVWISHMIDYYEGLGVIIIIRIPLKLFTLTIRT